MPGRLLLPTSLRILRQLRHDRRSIALVVLAPILLLTLVYYMLEGRPQVFHRFGLVMLGVFPFIIMFLLTSIAMLRERTSGTLERLFTTPVGKGDLLFGYGVSFGLAAAIQSTIAVGFAFWLLGLETVGSPGMVIMVAVANAVLAVALGLFCSAFAQTEFQAVQFLPVIVLPQLLLCGLFVPVDEMAPWLAAASKVMPLTYSVEALLEVGVNPAPTALLWRNLATVAGIIVVALSLGSITLRRRTP